MPVEVRVRHREIAPAGMLKTGPGISFCRVNVGQGVTNHHTLFC